nr:hypothetical protein [Tanacetum cinerariifolium]
ATGAALGTNSIWNSTWRTEGRPGSSLGKTSRNSLTTDSSQQSLKAKDKGKAKMTEPEKPLKRKEQIMIHEEFARNLEAQMQAKLEEEERLTRQKEEEANITLIES